MRHGWPIRDNNIHDMNYVIKIFTCIIDNILCTYIFRYASKLLVYMNIILLSFIT